MIAFNQITRTRPKLSLATFQSVEASSKIKGAFKQIDPILKANFKLMIKLLTAI